MSESRPAWELHSRNVYFCWFLFKDLWSWWFLEKPHASTPPRNRLLQVISQSANFSYIAVADTYPSVDLKRKLVDKSCPYTQCVSNISHYHFLLEDQGRHCGKLLDQPLKHFQNIAAFAHYDPPVVFLCSTHTGYGIVYYNQTCDNFHVFTIDMNTYYKLWKTCKSKGYKYAQWESDFIRYQFNDGKRDVLAPGIQWRNDLLGPVNPYVVCYSKKPLNDQTMQPPPANGVAGSPWSGPPAKRRGKY